MIDSLIERESQFTRKQSTGVQAEAYYQTALQSHCVQGEIPTGDGTRWAREKMYKKVKSSVSSLVSSDFQQPMDDHANTLSVQGSLLSLAAAEKQDIVWQSHKYDMKQGTLKFLLNAGLDTLPTVQNLRRWKKSPSNRCNLCRSGIQTTSHILAGCKVSLDQDRYTWRHNCLINYCVNNTNSDRVLVLVPGYQAPGGGSNPPEIAVTALKPDLVFIDKLTKVVSLAELTCPMEEHLEYWHKKKMDKYAHFLTDIPASTLTCFEVGNRGFISTRNIEEIRTLQKFMRKDISFKQFKSNLSTLSLLASHHIFNCRNNSEFMTPSYLHPTH